MLWYQRPSGGVSKGSLIFKTGMTRDSRHSGIQAHGYSGVTAADAGSDGVGRLDSSQEDAPSSSTETMPRCVSPSSYKENKKQLRQQEAILKTGTNRDSASHGYSGVAPAGAPAAIFVAGCDAERRLGSSQEDVPSSSAETMPRCVSPSSYKDNKKQLRPQENELLRLEVESLFDKCQTLTAEKDQTTKIFDEMRSEKQHLEMQVESLFGKCQMVIAEKEQLTRTCDALRSENLRLEEK